MKPEYHPRFLILRFAGLSFLFLLASMSYAPMILASSVGVAANSSAPLCIQQIDRQVTEETGHVVSAQAVENLATSSSRYIAATSGFNSTYYGYNDEWTFDPTNCVVTWHDAAANFLLKDAKGGKYTLVVTENPLTGTVYNVTRQVPILANNISPTNSETYSGYAIAANSGGTSAVDEADSLWYTPSVSAPTGDYPPSCDWTQGSVTNDCLVTVWDGLQNSTYDGPDHLPSHFGEVVQTGTTGNYTCNTHGICNSQYTWWSEYVRGKPDGTLVYPYNPEYNACGMTIYGGDKFVGQVGTKLFFNNTSSYYTYTILTDYTHSNICSHPYTSEVHAEYYADFFVEQPQHSTNSWFHLPKFTKVTWDDMGMATAQTEFGTYPDYTTNWGFGSYEYNYDSVHSEYFQDTTTSSMTQEASPYQNWGVVSVTWLDSAGYP